MAPYIPTQSYPSFQQASSVPEPAEQNHLLTQAWLWLPHMKCSLHNDHSLGAIYLIREVTWDGYAKSFRLQQLNGHSSKRDSFREVSEAELKAPSTNIDEMAIGAMTSPLISAVGRRRESVGSAGRLLGIGLTSEGPRYRGASIVGGVVGSLDPALYQQQQQQQYGNLAYQNGFAVGGGGSSRHWQSSNFDNGFLDDERDGSGSGNGRDRRQDRERERDRDDRRGHGKEKGRTGKGSGSGKKEKGRRGSQSPAGRSEGSERR